MPEEQVLAVAGGEPLRLSDSVRVRVFPSLHSCVWASGLGLHPAEECVGDLGRDHHERQQRMAGMLSAGPRDADPDAVTAVAEHLRESDQHARGDGGALAYLIETPAGSVLWKGTSGHWSGVLGHHDDWLPPFTSEPDTDRSAPGSRTLPPPPRSSTWATWREGAS